MADNHKHCDRFFTSMTDFCHGIKIVGFYDTLIVFWLTPITTGKNIVVLKLDLIVTYSDGDIVCHH